VSIKSTVELLRHVPLFAGVDPTHLQVLSFAAVRHVLQKGQTLYRAGDAGSSGYLVVSGTARATTPGSGEAVAMIERGAFLGELAMLAKLPHQLTVTATSTLTVNEIGNDLLLKLIGEFPESGARIVETFAAKLDSSMLMLREVQLLFEKAHSFSRR
jgi:CRP/FNR family transcriptional regulator, cyclic AMP receptor protein